MEKTDNELIEEFYVSQGGKPSLPADIDFYSSDWNMLVPVVEKINTLDFPERSFTTRFILEDRKCTFYYFSFISEESLIDAVYTVVVEFIKWYNSKN